MDIQLGQLRALVAVIEAGTLEAAAADLRVTPSAVSQRLKALETTLGRTLLQRTKPVAPTRSGEVVVRLARQLDLLAADALRELGSDGGDPATGVSIALVVNADSLATWALSPLVEVSGRIGITAEITREDQAHSTDLLREGSAMAAITSVASAVPGCSVRSLGRMRYRAVASPSYANRWFPEGVTTAALARAPMVVFDSKDDLQDSYLRRRFRKRLDPPRHHVPESATFAEAVRLGLGWGMLPDLQSPTDRSAGRLVDLDVHCPVDVTLYWQQWKLHSPSLGAVADAIAAAARTSLR